MTNPIPPISSAYLNIKQAIKNCTYALDEWFLENPEWETAEELLKWAIEDLEAAKAKVHKESGR